MSNTLKARASAGRGNSRLPLWLAWTGATMLGNLVGMSVSTGVVGSLLRPLGPVFDGLLNVFLYGAGIGLIVGVAQLAIMPRFLPLRSWLAATMIGCGIGFMAAALSGEFLGSLIDPRQGSAAGEGLIAILGGALVGLALGSAQWLALRASLSRALPWFAASIAGMVVGSFISAVVLGLWEVPVLSSAPAATVGAIVGLCSGLGQGLVLAWRRPAASVAGVPGIGPQTRIVLDTLLPGQAHPLLSRGILDTDWAVFYFEFTCHANLTLRLGWKLALFAAIWISPLLIRRLPPLTRYDRATRERALYAMEMSRRPTLRQMMLILKTVVGLCYGTDPQVRDALGYPRQPNAPRRASDERTRGLGA